MTDSLEKRRKAKEEEYFEKKNKELAENLAKKERVRLSPITGEPMEKLEIMGVTVDRCPTSGGIWLDAGELEQILKEAKKSHDQFEDQWLKSFFESLFSKNQPKLL
ncbi:MAG: hypothetical protein D6719_00215 [Candidatus Dadabacteria bacterium]|nr:MAG: hypothetical protein D6719_00215 [Candidatus Dadabacteria bacterium]